MVEIIKKGIPPSDITYTTTCRKCETTFSYKRSEAKMKYDFRDGDYLSIDCPVCSAMITKQAR